MRTAVAAGRRWSHVAVRLLEPCDVVQYDDGARHVVRAVHLVEGEHGTEALVIHADGADDRLLCPEALVRLIVAAP